MSLCALASDFYTHFLYLHLFIFIFMFIQTHLCCPESLFGVFHKLEHTFWPTHITASLHVDFHSLFQVQQHAT